jgi:pSer/pThr/pTyr-binding forkhead associated (FHA) protein
MIRIGRHRDNDVQLHLASVHRYHAVIHRSDDTGFVITDLSGEHGNGVRINGQRRAQAPLADGDRIELGRATLTFASTPL